MRRRPFLVIGAGLVALLVALGAALWWRASMSSAPDPSLAQSGGPSIVVAVGDIACSARDAASASSHTCRQAATADLAASVKPDAVLALGDTQYETGAISDYESSYDASWGKLITVTHPVPGNHEYETNEAQGYYTYFADQQPGPPGYYAFDLGTWRLYALNDECSQVDCAEERAWLDADLASHPRTCSLMYMHEPLYSSGAEHGDNPEARPFWSTAEIYHVDVALGGHDHDYERFAPLDDDGNRTATGIQSFVAGTGGRSLYSFGAVQNGSQARYNSEHGVLVLTLRDGAYGWEFRTITGDSVDSGSQTCR